MADVAAIRSSNSTPHAPFFRTHYMIVFEAFCVALLATVSNGLRHETQSAERGVLDITLVVSYPFSTGESDYHLRNGIDQGSNLRR